MDCFLATDQRGEPRPLGLGYDIGAYEAEAACTLLMDASYAGGTLTLDYVLGTVTPGTWNIWMFIGNVGFSLGSLPIPAAIHPPVSFPVAFAFPQVGTIGILNYIDTAANGIECWDFDLVDTEL